jgi:hypothetical protein
LNAIVASSDNIRIFVFTPVHILCAQMFNAADEHKKRELITHMKKVFICFF